VGYGDPGQYWVEEYVEILSMSRIVTFIIKHINMIILFACLVGWLDSSPIEIKKKLRHNL
jgi:hypothetical protein